MSTAALTWLRASEDWKLAAAVAAVAATVAAAVSFSTHTAPSPAQPQQLKTLTAVSHQSAEHSNHVMFSRLYMESDQEICMPSVWVPRAAC